VARPMANQGSFAVDEFAAVFVEVEHDDQHHIPF